MGNRFALDHGDASYRGHSISPMLLWTDPPYGTGRVQRQGGNEFYDVADVSYVCEAVRSWITHMDENGTIVVCCDYRLAPSMILAVGLEGWVYRGEIVWEFGLGRPRSSWWPVRHNNLLTFTRTETSGIFHKEAVPRVKRLAPKPGYADDKPSGSVWDFTMSNTHPDRVGYPNQKPVEIIRPFVLAHTNPDDLVLDPFCGSGSTGAAALAEGRLFYGIDSNPAAIETATTRLNLCTSNTNGDKIDPREDNHVTNTFEG